GEYRYFARPLPPLINRLRTSLYASLSGVANTWAERLDQDRRWPASHDGLVKECEAAGQSRPTPLLLRYGPGDYNRLHQDVYGDLVFPLQ
ncbi:2OG-Fe(II) oxygenase, partial [Acinetobacter baumannii]